MSETTVTTEPTFRPKPDTGLSSSLVAARQDLGSIERRRDRGDCSDSGLIPDYLGVIAGALVSIATSLETSAVAARLAEIGDVLETRTMSVAVSEFGA